jgi:hypothetical protein
MSKLTFSAVSLEDLQAVVDLREGAILLAERLRQRTV